MHGFKHPMVYKLYLCTFLYLRELAGSLKMLKCGDTHHKIQSWDKQGNRNSRFTSSTYAHVVTEIEALTFLFKIPPSLPPFLQRKS